MAGRPPTQWAVKSHRPKTPIRAHPSHPAARAQSQRRGSADLRVRSVVRWSEDTRRKGQPNHVVRRSPLHPSQRHRETDCSPTPTKFVPPWGILSDLSECPCKVKKWLGWKGGLGGSRVVLCPLERGASEECPVGGHRGPRSRHPVSRPWRTVCLDRRPSDGGWGDPGLFSAHRGGGLPTSGQRADTEVRAPVTLSLVPGGRCAWIDAHRTGGLDPPATRHPPLTTRLRRTIRGCPAPDIRLPSKMKHVSCGQRRGTAGAVIPPPSAIPP